MGLIRKLNQYLANVEKAMLVVIVLFMVALAFLQVILRAFFNSSILWGDIFLRHLVLWVGFIGASLATLDEKHINIDVFSRLLKGKKQLLAQAIVNLFAAVICYVLTNASWTFVSDEMEFGSTIFNNVPSWYFQIIIPIGFALMAIRFLLLTIEKSIQMSCTKEQA